MENSNFSKTGSYPDNTITNLATELKNADINEPAPDNRNENQDLAEEPSSPTSDEDSTCISEAGRFSLAAVCAISLYELFGNKWDREFCLKSIKCVIANLQLPQRVEPLMLEMVKGNVTHPAEPYFDLIYSEPFFKKHDEDFQNIIFNFITLAVHDGKYDARWRVLVQFLAQKFNIETRKVEDYEKMLIRCLLSGSERSQEEKNASDSRRLSAKAKRYALISVAAIGGGALIGVTGGLAAPLIGAGLTSIIGSSAVLTAISTVAGATVVGSLFGVAGGGLTGYKMKKRVGDIEEFEFVDLNRALVAPSDTKPAPSSKQGSIDKIKELHITIAISGWIKDKSEENYTKPWSQLLIGNEQYYLKYESSYLLELGKAMEYIFSFVASVATQEVLKLTVLSGLISAVTWPAGLLGLASVIDNPWGVCLRRSSQVGKQLAEVLLARSQGHRPVTLIGYSLGARVIYYCLREMSERKNCEGIIQDVIMIGAPCTAQASEWSKFTRVVAGRIVNGYNKEDWLLRFLYRTLSIAVDGVAGLQEIELQDRRMNNIDLTDMVTGHSDYPEKMSEILSKIGIPLST